MTTTPQPEPTPAVHRRIATELDSLARGIDDNATGVEVKARLHADSAWHHSEAARIEAEQASARVVYSDGQGGRWVDLGDGLVLLIEQHGDPAQFATPVDKETVDREYGPLLPEAGA